MNPTLSESGRAARFRLQMPLRYRVSGESDWHEGKTENISRSGVLFRAQHLIDIDASIEMSFVLPVRIPNEAAAEVVCSGQVVRTVPPSGAAPQPAIAAKIRDYRLIRGLARSAR